MEIENRLKRRGLPWPSQCLVVVLPAPVTGICLILSAWVCRLGPMARLVPMARRDLCLVFWRRDHWCAVQLSDLARTLGLVLWRSGLAGEVGDVGGAREEPNDTPRALPGFSLSFQRRSRASVASSLPPGADAKELREGPRDPPAGSLGAGSWALGRVLVSDREPGQNAGTETLTPTLYPFGGHHRARNSGNLGMPIYPDFPDPTSKPPDWCG